MKRLCKIVSLTAVAALLLALFAGCGGKEEAKPIVVSSKEFTESLIVGELYALALEDAGLPVERKLGLGGQVAVVSLENAEIDLYPEYTGTGLINVLKEEPLYNPDEVYEKVSSLYKEKWNIIWLRPSQANDSYGIVITKTASDAYGVKTISDLQANAGDIRFASNGSFEEVADGLPALSAEYGEFNFKSIETYDNALKYEVLLRDEADITVAYTTEGILTQDNLLVLEDDKNFWPPYFITPIVRGEVLEANPAMEAALNSISDALDTETMQALNAEVDLNKREYADVAKEFFAEQIKK